MAEENHSWKRMSDQLMTIPKKDYATLSWGGTRHGELGLGGIEEDKVLFPQEIPSLSGKEVLGVACGLNHTAIIVGCGVLHTCGNNDDGQLGHEKINRKKPEDVCVLGSQITVDVDCGARHSIAVTDTGQTFTWGSNLIAQLGRDHTEEANIRIPKLVKSLAGYFVLTVSCGDNHNVVLTDDGRLFAWGANTHGQLGQGHFSEKVDLPQQVTSLAGVPLSKLVAGSNHSLALTLSGALFAWGKNSFGQLGVGDQLDRYYPTLVKTLRYQHLKHIDAGEDHSIGLTEDGGVFTFGAGSHGQLGHNSNNNELLPRKVFELMGSVVSQIAAGRRHSVAYVPANGRTYTFGLGASGQLGTGKIVSSSSPICTNEISLQSLSSSNSSQGELENNSRPSFVTRRIFAGGDRCFQTITMPELNRPPDDMRVPDSMHQIRTVSSKFIENLVSVPPSLRPSLDMLEEVEKVFSSKCCINASFLSRDGGHYGCNSRNHGVDLDAAEHGFNRLRTLPSNCLSQKVLEVVEQKLIRELSTNPPDMEAMRVFLILPCSHLFDKPEYYATVHCPFAKTVISLERTPAKVLDMWWKIIPTENFMRIVQVYKNTVVHMLSLAAPLNDREIFNRQKCLKDCMDMLKKLHHVNQESGSRLSYEAYYIPELKDKLNIRADYINWLQLSQRPTRNRVTVVEMSGGILVAIEESLRIKGQLLSFCNYPFVFDGQAKTVLLQTDAMLQMQVAIDEVVRRNITSMIIPEIDPINPCLILYVTRNNILQDTIAQLSKQGLYNYKKPLKVVFLGEEAEDAGGVVKEFFQLIMRELLDPKYGMFQYFEESRLVWFNPETFEGPEMFRLVGLVCGLAIYNAIIIDLTFPLALFKKLLKKPVTIDDLCDLTPVVGRSMKALLEYGADDLEETFCLTFELVREVYGNTQHVELAPGGRHIAVNKANRQDYVDAYIDFTFNRSTQEQFDAFSEGFHNVCGGKVLALFHPQELQSMVVGNENYEWDELEKNCEYKGCFHKEHRTIKYFWEIFRELCQEDKKKFLRFLTGSDRIPIHGMSAIKMFIQPTGGGEDYLPVAHTCFNLLDLPVYSSKERLTEKLVKAIQQTEGFGIV